MSSKVARKVETEAEKSARIERNHAKSRLALTEALNEGFKLDVCKPVKARGIPVDDVYLIFDPDARQNKISRAVVERTGVKCEHAEGTEISVALWHSSDGLKLTLSFRLIDLPNLEIHLDLSTLNIFLTRFASSRYDDEPSL